MVGLYLPGVFEQVSENMKITLQKLHQLARDRKAVRLSAAISKPIPAAVVINMTGRTIHGFIECGMSEWKPKQKRERMITRWTKTI
jgi:hypothetical protein